MKKLFLPFCVLILIPAIYVPLCFAAPSPPTNLKLLGGGSAFQFQWTANHTNDNVDLYSMYWTRTSLDYSTIDGVDGGKVEVPSEDAGLVYYPPDINDLVSPQTVDYVEWDIPAVSQNDIVCFVVTATDNEDRSTRLHIAQEEIGGRHYAFLFYARNIRQHILRAVCDNNRIGFFLEYLLR